MCIIIHKPANVTFTKEDVLACHNLNKDGFGYMYHSKEENTIKVFKSVDMTTEQIQKHFETLTSQNVVFHFRLKTHGSIKKENCHPFPVLNKIEHGIDLWMVHNGVISKHGKSSNDETDTMNFIKEIVKPILEENPEAYLSLLESPAFTKMMGDYIGTSKLVFLDGNGKLYFVNKSLGTNRKDCWLSNDRPFPKATTYASYQYPYHYGNNRTQNSTTTTSSNTGVSTLPRTRYISNPRSKNFTFDVMDKVTKGMQVSLWKEANSISLTHPRYVYKMHCKGKVLAVFENGFTVEYRPTGYSKEITKYFSFEGVAPSSDDVGDFLYVSMLKTQNPQGLAELRKPVVENNNPLNDVKDTPKTSTQGQLELSDSTKETSKEVSTCSTTGCDETLTAAFSGFYEDYVEAFGSKAVTLSDLWALSRKERTEFLKEDTTTAVEILEALMSFHEDIVEDNQERYGSYQSAMEMEEESEEKELNYHVPSN